MQKHNKQQGFSIIDLIVSLVIAIILTGISAPNLMNWIRSYRVKGAARDLYANLQLSRMSAVKENRQYTMNFLANGYNITDEDGGIVKTVDFNDYYSGNIEYRDPTGTLNFTNPILTFNPNGLMNLDQLNDDIADENNRGFKAYLSDSGNSRYYRIRIPYITGSIRLEKWNGTNWE